MEVVDSICGATDREFVLHRLLDDAGKVSIWGSSLLASYKKVAALANFPFVRWTSPKRYLVLGSRIFNKLNVKAAMNVHLVASARDPLRLKRIPLSFSYDLRSYLEICRVAENDEGATLNHAVRRINKIIDSVNPQVLVANSTMDPINRLWIKCGKQRNIKIICLQHGVYGSAVPDYAQEEDIVDKYIALDDGQCEIVARNIDKRKIECLGVLASFVWNPPSCGPKVCFVGEDWERYGYFDLKREIIDTYREVAQALRLHGIRDIFYKPHPSEEQFYGVLDVMKRLASDATHIPDVYIGFSSSLLRDMASKGKLAIQVYDQNVGGDNFQSRGYCLAFDKNSDCINQILLSMASTQEVPCVRERDLEDFLL